MPQVALAKDDEPIETLGFCATDPRFNVWIQVRRLWWNGPEFQTIQFENRAELLRKLLVSIADDVGGPEFGWLVAEGHARVSGHLSHPNAVGIGRHVSCRRYERDECKGE